ncbi:hypothetical protein J4476_01735 [Candidatus Woesearchaeota archaeon]|nr:hypothetical protein [Candidatus Woesearchaeota archaeon]HIH25894.1 hypothetical protein [Nanoarchaeota archaeon]
MYGTNIYGESKARAYEISIYPKTTNIDTKLEVKEFFSKETLEGKVTEKTIDTLLEKLESIGEDYDVQSN